MTTVGFKKVIPAGGFNEAAIIALGTDIKTYIVNAQFRILSNNADGIDFIQSGYGLDEYGDDIPRWRVSTEEVQGIREIYPKAYLGVNYNDPSSNVSGNAWDLLANTSLPELTVHFAANGAQGWWWLHVAKGDNTQTSGYSHEYGAMGTMSRRYPADNHQGLCNRYGILDMVYGLWYPPKALMDTGVGASGPELNCWSPLAPGGIPRKRHAGSPLQKLAVPIYPVAGQLSGLTAFIQGELTDVMALTDGYTLGEVVAPGWVAMVGGDNQWSLAVRAPTTFTVL